MLRSNPLAETPCRVSGRAGRESERDVGAIRKRFHNVTPHPRLSTTRILRHLEKIIENVFTNWLIVPLAHERLDQTRTDSLRFSTNDWCFLVWHTLLLAES